MTLKIKKGPINIVCKFFLKFIYKFESLQKISFFFILQKVNTNMLTTDYILVCKDAIFIFKFFSELLVQKVKNFIGSHVYSLFL